MKTSSFPPPDPGTDASRRYDRFRNEVMAGGSVTEGGSDEAPPSNVQVRAVHARVKLACGGVFTANVAITERA